jgi:hypothetical protein
MADGEKPEFRICVYHMEHKNMLDRHEKMIDRMIGWVIAGAGSAILCLVGLVIQFAFLFMTRGHQ